MGAEFTWIRDDRGLTDALTRVGDGPLAFDLEADSFHHYRESVCLVQMSYGGSTYLVDPLDGADPSLLGPVLARSSVRKILHGADYDLRILHREHGLEMSGLFDTMIAARLIGETAFGLADLLARHLGVRLDKSHQRADWSRRPLPDEMVAYAVRDTLHLEELADVLEARLRELGREAWAEEENRALEAVRWTKPDADPDAYLRVKGARTLDRRGLTVLRELHALRDREARTRDVPPFRIMHDAVLVELARRQPAAAEELKRVPRLPRPLKGGRTAHEILDAVGRGLDLPPVERQERGRPRRPKPGAVRKRLEREARHGRDALALEIGLEPSVLLSRKLLDPILDRIERGEDWRGVDGLRRWQETTLEGVLDTL
jgi:ribonuclease D